LPSCVAGYGRRVAVRRQVLHALVDLPPAPTSPAAARAVLSQVLGTWGYGERTAIAVLLANELVTNAIRHGGERTVTLRIALVDDGRVRVEVSDGGPGRPELQSADPDRENGRGLHMVATLAERWGVRSSATGKTVWFDLSPEPAVFDAGGVT